MLNPANDLDDQDSDGAGEDGGNEAGDQDPPDDEDQPPRKRRKKVKVPLLTCSSLSVTPQTYEPSAEEEQQQEIILQLQDKYPCHDRTCENSGGYCFPSGPDAIHISLTHRHLRLWAAAKVWT